MSANEDLSRMKWSHQEIWSSSKHRLVLPSIMPNRSDISVWNIIKHNVGQELSKITMPVNLNEPLSFLQRLTEYLEFSHLLFLAEESVDPIKRIEYISAFAISTVSSNWQRLGKPFNPLLGETFEHDRFADRGFRIVCEQVSHQPPISAFHAESITGWMFYGSICPKISFWGKSVNIDPKGLMTIELPRFKETYTWKNVQCSIHNIIFGELWIEHHGKMEIINHGNNLKAEINWKSVGLLGSKDAHKIEGYIFKDNHRVRVIYGKWIDSLYSVGVEIWKEFSQTITRKTSSSAPRDDFASTGKKFELDNDVMSDTSQVALNLFGEECLWRSSARPKDNDLYYNFSYYAMQLNDLHVRDGSNVQELQPAPTDSRFRPDIRALEEGRIDDAKIEKNRLEEKQRLNNEFKDKRWQSKWFSLKSNVISKKEEFTFNNLYWERNWEDCPNIF